MTEDKLPSDVEVRVQSGSTTVTWTLHGQDEEVQQRLPHVIRYLEGLKGQREQLPAADGARQVPRCQVHGGPMNPSTKEQGTWFCPKKVGDGYCQERYPR